jgi:hypothetical protein
MSPFSDKRRGPSAVTERAALVISFILISAAYFYSAVVTAISKPFWMDEVLAVSTARLPTMGEVWSAIWSGAEFSPPTYHFFLHALIRLAGAHDDHLVARLPSIIAVYGAALCICFLVRRRLGTTAAVISLGVILCSGLFDYAVQARQYALLALGLGAALLIWDGISDTKHPHARALALWLILAICLCLHFYGIVVVATIGVAELLWFATRREFRWPLWLALAATGPVEAACYPLASHLAVFSAGDAVASNYYAKPIFGSLAPSLFDLMFGGERNAMLWLETFMLAGVAYLVQPAASAISAPDTASSFEGRPEVLSRLGIVIVALCTLPIITFGLSFFATKSFSARYMSEVALLSGIAVACMWSLLPARRLVALCLVPLLVVFNIHPPREPDPTQTALSSLDAARPPLPIVVGEGLLYIELMEAADPQTRSRLVYLLRPPGAISPDPTNENQVKRYVPFHADYKVSDQKTFLAANPDFYVVYRPNETVDTTTPSLMAQGLLGSPLTADRGVLIFGAAHHD